MVNNDTIELLNECSKGVKMGIRSIEDVLGHTDSEELKNILNRTLKEHQTIETDIDKRLTELSDGGKQPSMMASFMSEAKTGIKLSMSQSDSTIADLLSDGCAMGIKSLHRYINKYKAADLKSRETAIKLSDSEEKLLAALRPFL